MNIELCLNKKENNEGIYTMQEINKIIDENEDKILKFCNEAKLVYENKGIYNRYYGFRVIFDLNNKESHLQLLGQGIPQEIFKGIDEGYMVEVYRFQPNILENREKEVKDIIKYDKIMELLDISTRDKSKLLYQLVINSIGELKGYFSHAEEIFITNVLNGFIYTLNYDNKEVLWLEVHDAIDLAGDGTQYNVDGNEILNKISNLTDFQAFTVMTLAQLSFDYIDFNGIGWFQ